MNEQTRIMLRNMATAARCGSNARCLDTDFREYCRATDIGMMGFLQCNEAAIPDCQFSVPFGGARFCYCSVRVYAAKELGI